VVFTPTLIRTRTLTAIPIVAAAAAAVEATTAIVATAAVLDAAEAEVAIPTSLIATLTEATRMSTATVAMTRINVRQPSRLHRRNRCWVTGLCRQQVRLVAQRHRRLLLWIC
jgi:hypothetical protein